MEIGWHGVIWGCVEDTSAVFGHFNLAALVLQYLTFCVGFLGSKAAGGEGWNSYSSIFLHLPAPLPSVPP